MGQDIKDLDLKYDSDSTASNSIIDGYSGKEIDIKNSISTISTIAFTSSSNIQIGDRVVYNGPVTINQDINNLDTDGTKPVINKKFQVFKLNRRTMFIAAGVLVIFALTLSLVLTFMWDSFSSSLAGSILPELTIISRDEWGAKPSTENMGNLTLPLKMVIINHSVMRNCYTKNSCAENLREMQDVHLGWNFGDIGFNFVIGNDGNVFEGVGWDTRGAHTAAFNSKSIGISVNGNFKYEVPNKNQITALNLLLEQGIALGKLTADYKIYGGCQFKETSSPGCKHTFRSQLIVSVKATSTISDTTYDSDSTASNSIIEEYMCNELDGRNKQHASNISTIAVSSSSNIQIGDRVVYNGPVTIRQEFTAKVSDLKDVNLKSATESSVKNMNNIPKRQIRWKIFTVLSLLVFMFALLVMYMLNLNYNVNNTAIATANTSTILSESSNSSKFKLYSRFDWRAADPDGSVDPFNLPLSRVIVCHTVMKNCYTESCCIQNMKEMERLHMNLRFHHIGYNFVVCNDGNVYEEKNFLITNYEKCVDSLGEIQTYDSSMMEMNIKRVNLSDDSISSSTASNSDIEERVEVIHPHNNQPQPENSTQISSNINSIGVQSSSDVHFGNRIVCNGPVTIAQTKEHNHKDKSDEENLTNDVEKRIILRLKRFKILISLTGLIILLTLAATIIVIKLQSIDTQLPQTVNKSSRNDSLDVVLRSEWNANPPARDPNLLELPVDIILYDYIDMLDCYTKEACDKNIQKIQNDFINANKFYDIGYNFVITRDGKIYEGLGWDYKGYYSTGGNDNVLTIGFIYDSSILEMSTVTYIELLKLIIEGQRLRKLTSTLKRFNVEKSFYAKPIEKILEEFDSHFV
ncbi:unnamed protein product [Chironomus riparius]|uniref:Peptidoglycan recognition protein n=1 Tax=Chironomus riparius TaxID=315576 RepID=A0A9N9RXC3_9DIPT|nr:unnamed protein product [Chironomus riparius]